MEIRKIFWNGSSHLLSIPAVLARTVGLESGTFVSVQLLEDNTLKITKLDEQKGALVQTAHAKSARKRG